MEKLRTIKEAAEQLGVSKRSLQGWDNSGKLKAVRTEGGHRRYRQSDLDKFKGILESEQREKKVAVYCRVSSQDQKKSGDLDRQKARVLEYCVNQQYAVGFVFDEVCSGMKSNRPQLNKLFKLVFQQKINRVVVEYKDRLTRFQFEIFVEFFRSHGVEVEVVEEILPKSFEAELVEDMLSLLSSFSSRIYGKRSGKRRKKNKVKDNGNR